MRFILQGVLALGDAVFLMGHDAHAAKPGPDIKRTLVAMSDRTGMSISQVIDEVLYTGLIEMQELDEL